MFLIKKADKGNMRKILPDTTYGDVEKIAELVKKERNVKLANQLNAMRLLMLGYEQKEVAMIYGVTRRAVLKWVNKWNQGGKEILQCKSGGYKSKVTDQMRMEISKIIDVKREIEGRTVTGKLICGYIKKNTI